MIDAFALSLLIFQPANSTALSNTAQVATSQYLACDPIGRVVTGINNMESSRPDLPSSGIICNGDRLVLQEGSSVQVLCFSNRRLIDLSAQSGSIPVNRNLCAGNGQREQTNLEACGQSVCFTPKGDDTAQIQFLSPGLVINTCRPVLHWSSVIGAERYTIIFSGDNIFWQKTTEDNIISYPEQQPELQPGNAYRVGVIAYRSQGTVFGETVFNVEPSACSPGAT